MHILYIYYIQWLRSRDERQWPKNALICLRGVVKLFIINTAGSKKNYIPTTSDDGFSVVCFFVMFCFVLLRDMVNFCSKPHPSRSFKFFYNHAYQIHHVIVVNSQLQGRNVLDQVVLNQLQPWQDHSHIDQDLHSIYLEVFDLL